MPDRPPSVDALARELADVGLPHPLLVDAARAAIAAGEPASARARAEAVAAASTASVNGAGATTAPPRPAYTPPPAAQESSLDAAALAKSVVLGQLREPSRVLQVLAVVAVIATSRSAVSIRSASI